MGQPQDRTKLPETSIFAKSTIILGFLSIVLDSSAAWDEKKLEILTKMWMYR